MPSFPHINLLAVLVSALESIGSGGVYWGVIANPLTRLLGGTPERVPMPPAALVAALLTRIVLATVLAIFLGYAGAKDLLTGVLLACLACIGFVLTYRIGQMAFWPMSWAGLIVGFGEVLLGFALMGAIIGAWS